jgi:hypothetical protein
MPAHAVSLIKRMPVGFYPVSSVSEAAAQQPLNYSRFTVHPSPASHLRYDTVSDFI